MGGDDNIVKQLGLLPKYGLVGVFFALIALAAFMGYLVLKISGNHINHATEATIRNTEAWNNNTETLGELKGSVNLLSEVIRQKIK